MSLGKILAMDLPAQAKLSHYPLLGMIDGIFWSHMTGITLQLVKECCCWAFPCASAVFWFSKKKLGNNLILASPTEAVQVVHLENC